MQKVDRLGWASGVCFWSYGLKIGVRVNVPTVPEEVYLALPPGWKPAEPPFVDLLYSLRIGQAEPGARSRPLNLLFKGLQMPGRHRDLAPVLEVLEGDLQLHVAEHAKNRVFVHAGVVGWKGRAILLPGRSFAGKSTLVSAMLRAGATYYSDEYAVLDESGLVHPYPRRVALRQSDRVTTRRVSASELGAAVGSEPLPVGAVVLTKYKADSQWRPRTVSPGKALMELLNNTIPAQTKPEQTLSALQKILPRAMLLKGIRGEAEETADALLRSA